MHKVLTIAGSDSSGGAGIQADIKTITCNGVYAMSAVTALTAQNTKGIISIMEVSPEFLADELDAVFTDIIPDSIKIGMVCNSSLITVIAEKLRLYDAKKIVLDPVMISSSGTQLLKSDAVQCLTEKLFPMAFLLTPNIPECEFLLNRKILRKFDMEKAAEDLNKQFGCNILVKGGHFCGDSNDFLFCSDGTKKWFECERIENHNTHGTGCTLSSAISSNLAKGLSICDSVFNAKEYISGCIKANLNLGKGNGPLMHNYALV